LLWLGSVCYTNELEAQLGLARLAAQAGLFGSRANLIFFFLLRLFIQQKTKFEKSKINKKIDDLMLVLGKLRKKS